MRGLGGAILDQREKSYGLRLAEQQDRRNLSFYTMDFRPVMRKRKSNSICNSNYLRVQGFKVGSTSITPINILISQNIINRK